MSIEYQGKVMDDSTEEVFLDDECYTDLIKVLS